MVARSSEVVRKDHTHQFRVEMMVDGKHGSKVVSILRKRKKHSQLSVVEKCW